MKKHNSKLDDWKQISSQLSLRTPVFDLVTNTYTHPDIGKDQNFFLLDSRDWINIVAIDTKSVHDTKARMLWVKQFRMGSRSVTYEIPGGATEGGDVNPLISAQRELLEETGAKATEWIHLGSASPNPAIHTNAVHTYLALGCEQDPAAIIGDGGEVLEVEWLPVSERWERIKSGHVNHSLVMSALLWLEMHMVEKKR